MSKAVKIVAGIEAVKGALALLAATAVLSLAHEDLHALVLSLVEHLHLNPAAKYPRIFLLAAGNLHNTHLVLIALGAAAYSTLRFVEAFGLYRGRAWAEVLASGSGAVYVPFELAEFVKQPAFLHFALLAANLVVVGIMVHSLLQRRSRSSNHRPGM